MSNRGLLRSTTMLSGMAGGAFLVASAAWAADMTPPLTTKDPLANIVPATLAPAVDAVNYKLDGFGGELSNRTFYGSNGSVTFPLGGQFGAQIDGTLGGLDNRFAAAAAGHLFWRNPGAGLLGVYGSWNYWDQFGGANVGHVAAEGEAYWGQFTLQGIVGVEFGNSVSGTTPAGVTATTVVGPVITTTTAMTASLINGFSVPTRVFDEINLKYYFTNDISGYAGHRYLGGRNALALGAELAQPLGRGVMASAFVEGWVGEDSFTGIWGGLKLYFGPNDKPLITRQRTEDPNNWDVDNFFGILNNHTTNTTSSSSSTESCTNGTGGGPTSQPKNCELPIPASDRRLKRDVVLLTQLANGLGVYRFRYLWSDTIYVGLMAQEVMAVDPGAVVLATDGFFRVNYSRLGLRMLTWKEWQAGKSIEIDLLARLAA